MDSAHAEAAVLLINAGADRTRVRIHWTYPHGAFDDRGTPFLFCRKILMVRLQKIFRGLEDRNRNLQDSMSLIIVGNRNAITPKPNEANNVLSLAPVEAFVNCQVF